MNPIEIKARKPPNIKAKQAMKRTIFQLNAIREILDNRTKLRSKVCEDVRSFFNAIPVHALLHGLFIFTYFGMKQIIESLFYYEVRCASS